MLTAIQNYTTEKLKLDLNTPVLGKTSQGVPFLGFLIKQQGIYLLRKSKRRVIHRVQGIEAEIACQSITWEKAAERILSVYAAIKPARTRSFRMKLQGSG